MEYFAKIDEPKKLRIGLMTAAKESIIACSILENIEDIRQKKLNLTAELREDFRDASISCKELSELISDEKTRKAILDSFNEFHKKELAAQNIQAAMTKANGNSTPKAAPVPKAKQHEVKYTKEEDEPLPMDVKKKTDVDRLEYTLSQIEQKLADLNK
jgi:hypothetical protein